MRVILVQTGKETLPKKERRVRPKWMTEEILSMMGNRQRVRYRQGHEYRELDYQVKKKCREAKERWLNDQCSEIEGQFGNEGQFGSLVCTRGSMKSPAERQIVHVQCVLNQNMDSC